MFWCGGGPRFYGWPQSNTAGMPAARHNPAMTTRLKARRRGRRLAWLLFFLIGDAAAWNAAGHRLSAIIAWQEMSAGTRREVAALLDRHPAAADWEKKLLRGKTPAPLTPQALFAAASTWPDEVRRQARDADPSSPAAVGAHRDWHYVNWPVNRGPSASRGGGLDREIVRQAARLGDRRRPEAERAEALAWLIHLVGDAHQPLHVASWPDAAGGFDDGGLAFPVHDAARPRLRQTSLHVWWDDLPGSPWLRGERLEQRANALRQRFPAPGIRQGRVRDWLGESFAAAKDWVRPKTSELPWEVSADYRTRAAEFCDRRLAEAGVRLARLLETTLAR